MLGGRQTLPLRCHLPTSFLHVPYVSLLALHYTSALPACPYSATLESSACSEHPVMAMSLWLCGIPFLGSNRWPC